MNGTDHPKIFLKEIVRCERLGQGSYGRVNRGVWNHANVAVKEFDMDDMETYDTELDQLARVNHPNIIQLLASSREKVKFLVMEYADRGSLYKVLHVNKQGQKQVEYNSGHAISWCLQCAAGVEYLHNVKPHPIIHRDLKSPNLLLFSDGLILKICDFGTACNKRTIMTNNKGSAPWMAPEVFSGKNYTEKCDIFSFGIIMWEVLTRKLPFHDCCDNAQQIQWAKYVGRRPPKINKCPEELWRLMDRCWSNSTTVRPNMTEVVEVIRALQPSFPDASVPLDFPEDEQLDTADSSSYVSALNSLTSQEVLVNQSLLRPCSDIGVVTAMYRPMPTPNSNNPEGVQYNNYTRYGTPLEEPFTEIPRLPAMDPNAWKNAPPGLVRERSLQDHLALYPNQYHHPNVYPYGAPLHSYSHLPYLNQQPSPNVDRLGQGMDGLHLEEPKPAAVAAAYFHPFPNIVGNTYHPQSETEEFRGLSQGWLGNPPDNATLEQEEKCPTPTQSPPTEPEAAGGGGDARTPYHWLSGNLGYASYAGLGAAGEKRPPAKRPPPQGIGVFLPRPPANRLSPYSHSPYNVSPHGSQEMPSVDKPSSVQSSFRKGHRRSCSDGSSGEKPTLNWQYQHQQPWGRSYSHLGPPHGPPTDDYHNLLPPHLQHPEFYDTLDRDINLISPELRPIPPQPNCPQSMRIYEDSRMVAAALLNAKLETNQLQMQKAELENKLNQTDAEFALSLAEANDGSFPFDKERVEKYFDLKAQKTALTQYHDSLALQYEQQKKKESEPNADKKSRNPFKRLFHHKAKSPVPDPVDVKSKPVEDWEWVDKNEEEEPHD